MLGCCIASHILITLSDSIPDPGDLCVLCGSHQTVDAPILQDIADVEGVQDDIQAMVCQDESGCTRRLCVGCVQNVDCEWSCFVTS